jgi:hypothetical protein
MSEEGMPETRFGCFALEGQRSEGHAALVIYRLARTDPAIEQAWGLLTGRVENPLGHRALFHEDEDPAHAAEVQRLIRAHIDFGGEDLLLVFDPGMRLVQVEISGSGTVLWRSCPGPSVVPGAARTQRFSTN